MRERPLIYNGLSLFNFIVAIAIPLQIALIFKHGPSEFNYILDKITFTNWIVMITCAMSSVAFYHAHKSLRYLIPLTMVSVFINNLIIARYGMDFSAETIFFSTIIFLAIQGSLFLAKESNLIRNQHMRWWLIPKRYPIHSKVFLIKGNEKILLGETYDISRTGLFLKYDAHFKEEHVPALTTGEDLHIEVDIDENSHIISDATIVRKSLAKGTYPAGIGMRFKDLSTKDYIKLNSALIMAH